MAAAPPPRPYLTRDEGSAGSSRLSAIIAFLVVLGLAGAWAAIEPEVRRNPVGARVLDMLERPLLQLGDLSLSLGFIIKATLFIIALTFLVRKLRLGMRRYLGGRAELDPGQVYAIEKTAGYVVFLLGAIIGLQSAGINLNSLALVGGALGLGIGLGFQESANNFLSGLILLLERPIKVGDRVQVGDLDGDVIRIGSRATWVRTNADITVIVPNSQFVMQQVINWTATGRRVRFSVPLGVSYKADPVEVREALLHVAGANREVLEQPPPDVIFTGFGDSALNFELRVWTNTMVRTPKILRSDLYFEIFAEFARRNIEIPFPQQDIHLRSAEVPLVIERREPSGPGPGKEPEP